MQEKSSSHLESGDNFSQRTDSAGIFIFQLTIENRKSIFSHDSTVAG